MRWLDFQRLIIGVLVLIGSARLAIDLPLSSENIPITGQTLGVILVAWFLPKYWGSLAIFIYLLLGFVGLPVLAGGEGGMEKFTGGSAGFLFGFLFAGLILNKWFERIEKPSFASATLFNIVGTIIILIAGNGWLVYKYSWADGLAYGFFPFWKGAVIKVFLGALIIFIYSRMFNKEKT